MREGEGRKRMSGRRMIHDDICEDRKLNAVSEGAEVLFYRLLSKTDDYGRFYGDPALLKGQVFPRRHELTVQVIASRLVELVDAELILAFEAEDGELIVQFKNFEKRQAFRRDIKRKARFPEPGSRVTPSSSKELVSALFGSVTGPSRVRTDADGSEPEPERPRTDSGLKTSEVKERKDKESEGGGGVSNESETEPNVPVPDSSRGPDLPSPPPPSPIDLSSHLLQRVPQALGEETERAVEFLTGIYGERFPNSRVPARSARGQVERALACKLSAQDIYEAFERTAVRSTTRAEKIWEILDPLIASRSAAEPEVEAGGLSLRELQEIALRATDGGEGGGK